MEDVFAARTVSMPCWLPDRTERNYLSVANGLLDIDAILADRDMSVCLLPHSSNWFCSVETGL